MRDAVAFVGRTAELDRLLAALRDARHGTGQTVAVLGAAGAGKSRLARELLDGAREDGVAVLVGRAVPGPAPTPYRALREALLAWSREHPLPASLDPAHREVVTDVLRPHGEQAAPVAPLFVAESLLRLLAATTPGGAVLFLEDLHWADAETLEVVEYLADHPQDGVLALLTCRDEETSAGGTLLRRLAGRGGAELVRLTPLPAAHVTALATELLGSPPSPSLADQLVERSDGVPLLVVEILAALSSAGRLAPGPDGTQVTGDAAAPVPSNIAETVDARLAAVDAGLRPVLHAAALLGRSIDHQRLAAVAGRSASEVEGALRAGLAAALLEEDPARPGDLRFRHALVRDAVELAAFPPDRARTARRALAVLLEVDPGDLPDLPELPDLAARAGLDAPVDPVAAPAEGVPAEEDLPLAVDLAVRCGDRRLAVRFALRAARAAFDRWALRSAEEWLAQARVSARTDPQLVLEVDVEHLRVAAIAGRPEVVRRLGRALLARDDLPPQWQLEAHLRLAQALLDDGLPDEAVAHLDALDPLLSAVDAAWAWTAADLWRAELHLALGDRPAARTLAERAIERAVQDPDQRDLALLGDLVVGRSLLPDVAAASTVWRASADRAGNAGMRLWRARHLAELAAVAIGGGEGEPELAEAAAIAAESGAVELWQRLALLDGERWLLLGDPERCRATLDRVVDETGCCATGLVDRRAGALRAVLDRLDGAPDAAPDAVPDPVPVPDDGLPPGRTLRGLAALLEDDPASAAAHAPRDGERPPFGGQWSPLFAALDAALGVVADVGSDHVPAGLDRTLDHLPDGWVRALALRVVAERVPATGPRADGAALQDPLRRAVADLERTGLSGLAAPADACRALLRRAGVPVPRRSAALDGVPEHLRVHGVTTRELEVLRLVAQGLTTRAVADRLFLSPRTVEKHVERLMLKTGAANRAALAALLGDST